MEIYSGFILISSRHIQSWRRVRSGALLPLDELTDVKGFPLLEPAAQHWAEHARFDKVSSRIKDGTYDLFDTSKPHFAAWLQVHDIESMKGGRISHNGCHTALLCCVLRIL
jgi:hypothetical protein